VAVDVTQPLLDEAVGRLRRVMPKRVRLRAWIGPWPEPLATTPPLVDPWEHEPRDHYLSIEWFPVRRLLHWEKLVRRIPLEEIGADGVLEALLVAARPYVRYAVADCEPRVEIGAHQIRWWYERGGDMVVELEPLPWSLPSDDGGSDETGVREPRRPIPHAPSAEDAVDPAA
jgi:hypothetical protein